MNTALKRHGVNLLPGSLVKGCWHGQEYTIVRKIGEGVVGTVYLSKRRNEYLALKISRQSTSITMEVNVLKSLQKVRDKGLGPLLVDADDFKPSEALKYSFYVMEYVAGRNIRNFIEGNGTDWLGVFLLQILYHLEDLHRLGYVFGDLKVDHILIEPSPPKVRLIDFGGATKRGRAVKEFTEFYDRGYWKLGSRRAEPSYDLFSLVLVVLHIFYPKEFNRGSDPRGTLFRKIERLPHLKAYELVLKRAILGRYDSAKRMAKDLQEAIYKGPGNPSTDQGANNRGGVKSFLIEITFFLVLITLYSVIVYFYI